MDSNLNTGQVPEGGKHTCDQVDCWMKRTPTEGGKPEAPCWNCDSMDWESADGSYWRCAVCREFPVPAPVQAKPERPLPHYDGCKCQRCRNIRYANKVSPLPAPEPQPESELTLEALNERLIEVERMIWPTQN